MHLRITPINGQVIAIPHSGSSGETESPQRSMPPLQIAQLWRIPLRRTAMLQKIGIAVSMDQLQISIAYMPPHKDCQINSVIRLGSQQMII
jgi:hypothetical protein